MLRAATRAEPRRVDWKDATDLEAMVLAANGWPDAVIAEETGLSQGQVQYRRSKAEIRLSDYRKRKFGTLGGRIAERAMSIQLRTFTPAVANTLKRDFPTKTELRHNRHAAGVNGNGYHVGRRAASPVPRRK